MVTHHDVAGGIGSEEVISPVSADLSHSGDRDVETSVVFGGERIGQHAVTSGVTGEGIFIELLTVNFLNEFILNVFLILFALIDEVVLIGELV